MKYTGRNEPNDSPPEWLTLHQKFARKCHAPQMAPTMSPVASTPYRVRNLGIANPVQPSSSAKPPVGPLTGKLARLTWKCLKRQRHEGAQ